MASIFDQTTNKLKKKLSETTGADTSRSRTSTPTSQSFNVASSAAKAATASVTAALIQNPVQQSVREKIQQRAPTYHRKNTPSVSSPSTKKIPTFHIEAPKNWYSGSVPTSREALAQIYRTTEGNDEERAKLFDQWYTETMDTASPYYNPYFSGPTSQAVSALRELGWDLSDNITAADLAALRAAGDYTNVGVSGTPKAPSSKSTAAQDIAYWTYQLEDDIATSDKVDAEWSALQTYMNRKVQLGYSDDEIIASIDWGEYPTLAKLDEGIASRVPVQTARATDYSQDALYGVLYAARNDGGTGNRTSDIIQYMLGTGNQYKPNAASESARDPGSTSYMPYTRSTIDDAVLYFGQQTFDSEWLEANRNLLSSGDATAAKLWQKIYDAQETTDTAIGELVNIQKWALDQIKRGRTASEIVAELGAGADSKLKDDYPTLYKMEQARQRGSALETTQPIGFAIPYFEDWLEARANGGGTLTLPEYVGIQARGLDIQIPTGMSEDELTAARDLVRSFTTSFVKPTDKNDAAEVEPNFDFARYDTQLQEMSAVSPLLANQEADNLMESTVDWLQGKGEGNAFTDKYGWMFDEKSSNVRFGPVSLRNLETQAGAEVANVIHAIRDSELTTPEEYVEAVMHVARDYEAAYEEGMALDEYYAANPSAKAALEKYATELTARETAAAEQAQQKRDAELRATHDAYYAAVEAQTSGTATPDQTTFISAVQGIDAAKAGQQDDTYNMLIGTVAQRANNDWTFENGPVGAGLAEANVTREARQILAEDMQLAAVMEVPLSEYYQQFGIEMNAEVLYHRATQAANEKTNALLDGMSEAESEQLTAMSEVNQQAEAEEEAAKAQETDTVSFWKASGLGAKTGLQQFAVSNANVVDVYVFKAIEDAWLDSVRANFTRDEYYQYCVQGIESLPDGEEKTAWQKRLSEAKDIYEVGFCADYDTLENWIRDQEESMAVARQYVQENGDEIDELIFDYTQATTSNALSAVESAAISQFAPKLGIAIAYGAPQAADTARTLMAKGADNDAARLAGIGSGALTTVLESMINMEFLPEGFAHNNGSGVGGSFSKYLAKLTTSNFGSTALRTGGRLIGSSLSEAAQEGIETAVQNVYQYVATGVTTGDWTDFDSLDDVGRAMVMAALTTVPMTATSIAYEYGQYNRYLNTSATLTGHTKSELRAMANSMMDGSVTLAEAAEAARDIYLRDILPNQAAFDKMVERVAVSDYKVAAVRALAGKMEQYAAEDVVGIERELETIKQGYNKLAAERDARRAEWQQVQSEFLANPTNEDLMARNLQAQKLFSQAKQRLADAETKLSEQADEVDAMVADRKAKINQLMQALHIEATHAVRDAMAQGNAASSAARSDIESGQPPFTPELESAVVGMHEAEAAADQARQESDEFERKAAETEQDMAEGLIMVGDTPAQTIVDEARAKAQAARDRAALNDARREEFVEYIYQNYSEFDQIDNPVEYAEEMYKAKLAEQSATRAAATEPQATTETAKSEFESTSGLKGMAKRDSSGSTTVSEQVARAESTDKSTKIDKSIEAPVVTMRKLAKKMGVGEGFGARRRLRTESPVLGYYDPVNKSAITVPGTNSDYGVESHELGHHLAERLNMTGTDQMVAALDPEYAKAYTPEALKDEAFAIFVSHYMAGDIDLTTYASPQFIREFELGLKKAKLAKDVHAARDKIQKFAAANTASRMHAMVTKAGTQDEQQTFREKVVTGTFDDTYAAKAVDEATRKAGGEAGLREAARYYNKHTLGMAETIFTGNFINPDGTPIDASIADRLKKLKVKDSDYDKVVIYMTAKHAWDRLNHERKVDGEYIADPIRTFGDMTANASEIKAYLDQIESSTDPSDIRAIKAAETILDCYNEFMEVWAVGEGMIEKEAWLNYRRTYPHYVPMAREGFSSFDAMKNATGSDRRIKNPLQTMFLSMEKMVYRVYRNRMAQQFDSQYQSGGLGIFARPYDMVDKGSIVSLTQQDIQEAQAKVAESGGGDLDLLDLLNRKLDDRKVSHSGTDQEVNNVLHVIRKDGTEAHYVIENPELYELLTQNGNHSMAKGLQAVGRITSAVTQLQTSSNPLFALRNAVRDYQKSVNYGSWAYTYLDGIPKWFISAFDVVFKKNEYPRYAAMGNAGWHLREQIIRTDKVDNELMGKLFKGWRGESGKATATAKKAGKKVFNFVTLSKVNEWIEQTSRYAEYKYGKHDKSTPEGRRKAYMAAQEATLDFALSGNSKNVQGLRKVMPFMNATLQSTYQLAYMFDKSQRDRLAPRLVKTIINNMITAAMPIVCMELWGSDEDKEQYALLPDEMKATNIIFPNPGPNDEDGRRFVRVPIAQDPMAQLSYLMGLEAASRVVDGEANDMDLDLWLTAHSILTNMFPDTTILSPVIDISRNVNWYGGSIVPTNLENEPAPRQKKETTPELFVNMSKGLYKLGIQLSPLKIQYLLEQYTGFFGQIGIPAISPDPYNEDKNFGLNLLETFGEKFVNGWTLDPAFSNDISSAFYDQYDTMEQIYKSVKAGDPIMLKSGIDPSQYDSIRDQAYGFYHSGGALYEAKEEVNDIWDDINEVMESDMPEDQKTILVRNYRDQIVQVMKGALQETAPFIAEYIETPLDIQKFIFGTQ